MRQRFYPAVLEREDNGFFGLWFPDFPNAVAAGGTQEEAMARGQDALARAMQDRAEQDGALPDPTPLDAIALPEDCDFVTYLAVGATPPNPSERVNVYLPRGLIERVDRAAEGWGMTRSSLFGLAVTQLLNTWPSGASAMVAQARKKRA